MYILLHPNEPGRLAALVTMSTCLQKVYQNEPSGLVACLTLSHPAKQVRRGEDRANTVTTLEGLPQQKSR